MKTKCGLLLSLLAMIGGCGPEGDGDSLKVSDFTFQTSVLTALETEGEQAYATYCVGCHGVDGDGKGKAATFLDPKPRDFILANYKFSSTRSGQLPTDEDLRRSIVDGLKGSAMPEWDLLPARTVTAMIAYLKTFSPKWKQRGSGVPIPEVPDPYGHLADKSKAIARGEVVYHGFATCWTCHPTYVSKDRINETLVAMENPTRDVFRENLLQAEGKENKEGQLIYPPDFERDFVRSGASAADLYRSIGAGITGTAMPTWIDSMDIPSEHGDGPLIQPQDVWALAYYVQDLIIKRPAKVAQAAVDIRLRPQKIYLHGEPPAKVKTDQSPGDEEEFLDDAEEFDEEFEEE